MFHSLPSEQLFAGTYTLKEMQPRQIAGIGLRKCREQVIPRLPVDFDKWYDRKTPQNITSYTTPITENNAVLRDSLAETTRVSYQHRVEQAVNGSPEFMNRQLTVTAEGSVRWFDERFDDLPMLWRLKLYAFQSLYWTVAAFDPDGDQRVELQSTFDQWIDDWINSVSVGRPDYLRREWTPWAVSLRLLHWCRYLAWRDQRTGRKNKFEDRFRRECYKNALFLERHVEWDVGGNHLIENGAALVMAGVVFAKEAWVKKGQSILVHAADTQFLDDGCHFERSPMYHILTLTRYLTVHQLLESSGRKVPKEIAKIAEQGAQFLHHLRPEGGSMPLLNDSVHGQALPLDDCLSYAERIGFSPTSSTVTGSNFPRDSRPSQRSGYQWLRTKSGELLFDAGPVGPSHLPGHSHSDTLNVLLWVDGQPVITDTGTYGYVDDQFRQYARGVRGHNTVQVGDVEPISISGKYLMGPRPSPRTRTQHNSITVHEGCYESAPYRGPEYDHHRAVYGGDSWWLVWDSLRDFGQLPLRSRLHLHPDLDPEIQERSAVSIPLDSSTGYCYPLASDQMSIVNGWHFPRFGVAQSRPVIELFAEKSGAGTAGFGYLLSTKKLPSGEPKIRKAGDYPSSLQVEEKRVSLPQLQLRPDQS